MLSNTYKRRMRYVKQQYAGTDHRKFMWMIEVYVDITAPLYWSTLSTNETFFLVIARGSLMQLTVDRPLESRGKYFKNKC